MTDLQSDGDNNMVNLYNSRLKEIHLDEKINETRRKLDQWRDECHKTIDEFYQRKLEELNLSIDECRTKYEEKRTKVQTNITQLNDQQNQDSRETIIQSIEEGLNDVERATLEIHLRSLTIDDNYIHIEKEFDFENLRKIPTTFFYTSESSSAIASNERFLLMHQNLHLNLIDQDSKITKQSSWQYGWICDMCWSKTLGCFIVITANSIYFVNDKLESCPPLQEDNKQNWFSCTCSEEFLYVSTCQWGSSIFQFSLTSPLDFIEQWKSPLTCENDEGINDIKYNNGTLALLIKNPKEHQKRMDLKSAKTFATIWSLVLGIEPSIRLFTCCPINFNEWLVIDGTNSKIYQITKDGKFKNNSSHSHSSIPYRANLFNSNMLAVSVENELEFYHI